MLSQLSWCSSSLSLLLQTGVLVWLNRTKTESIAQRTSLTETSLSPVCPHSALRPPCLSCPSLLSLSPIQRSTLHPGPRPASGLSFWCPPAAHDPSLADAASSSLSASPSAARGHRLKKSCTLIPAGHGSSASPVNHGGSSGWETPLICDGH